jgi:hypothetical protein
MKPAHFSLCLSALLLVGALIACSAHTKISEDILNEQVTTQNQSAVQQDVAQSTLSEQNKTAFERGLASASSSGHTGAQIIASQTAADQQASAASQQAEQDATNQHDLQSAVAWQMAYTGSAMTVTLTNTSGRQIYCYNANVTLSTGQNDDWPVTGTILYNSRAGLGPNTTITLPVSNVKDDVGRLKDPGFNALGKYLVPQEVEFAPDKPIFAPNAHEQCWP